MKLRSRGFRTGLAAAFAGIVSTFYLPLLNSPVQADDPWIPSPCPGTTVEEFEECDIYLQWQIMHRTLWRSVWGATWDDGASAMLLTPPSELEPNDWGVKMVEVADLDYENDDITQEQFEAMVIDEGTFSLEYEGHLLTHTEVHTAPDGEDITHLIDLFVVSGILTGDTTQARRSIVALVEEQTTTDESGD